MNKANKQREYRATQDLISAIKSENTARINTALDMGANINCPKFLPLYHAVNSSEKVLETILRAGADPNTLNDNGQSTIAILTQENRPHLAVSIVRILNKINKRINPDEEDENSPDSHETHCEEQNTDRHLSPCDEKNLQEESDESKIDDNLFDQYSLLQQIYDNLDPDNSLAVSLIFSVTDSLIAKLKAAGLPILIMKIEDTRRQLKVEIEGRQKENSLKMEQRNEP